ncbi:MAG: nucleotidyltransferase [Actinomycetota bacterium]|nr:nucleotidyltransferase [Actinomycetota bacterium]
MTEHPGPPARPLDLMKLLETLARHGVEHVVVGGIAVQVHGHRRTTKDLDLIPSPVAGNHERLAGALDELDAQALSSGRGGRGMATDAEQLRIAPVVPPLTTHHGEVHILNEPKGAAPYDDLRTRALVLDLDGLEVAVVGLDDLIRMKRASGRPEDLEDIAVLVAVERGE